MQEVIQSSSYIKSLLFILCLSSQAAPLISCDSTNNSCHSAEALSAITLEEEICLSACTTPGTNSNILTNFQGCEASLYHTIWYSLKSPATKTLLSAQLTSATIALPLISIYHGTCDNYSLADCNQGYDGSVTIRNLFLSPETEYYIAVSSADNSAGEFELCLTLEEDPNVCNTNASLEIISTSAGSPHWGPYQPNEEVEVCYTVQGYQNVSCNYLQAFIPLIGNGWDPTSLDSEGKPVKVTKSLITQGHTNFTTSNPSCEGDAAGEWRWHAEGAVKYNLNSANPLGLKNRDVIPGGWVFVNSFDPSCFNFNDGCCTNPDEDPNLGYGDDDYPLCNTGPTQNWTICFALKTRSEPTLTAHDCSIGMKTLADGEIGALIDNGCNADLISYTNATVIVCQPPTVSVVESKMKFCSGQVFSLDLSSDDPNTVFFWREKGQDEVTFCESNVLEHSFSESGTYYLELIGNNGCDSAPLDIEIEIIDQIEVKIIQEPQIVCAGDEVELIVRVDGVSDMTGIDYSWNFENSADASVVTDQLDQLYEVSVTLGACQMTSSRMISHHELSSAEFLGDKICHGESAELAIRLDGQGPWSILLEDNAGDEYQIVTNESEYSSEQLLSESQTYNLRSAIDGNNCRMATVGEWTVDVMPELEVWAGQKSFLDCDSKEAQLDGQIMTEQDDLDIVWIDNSGGAVPNATSLTPVISTPGTYTLIVTDMNTGCSASDSVVLENNLNLELQEEIEIELGESIFLEPQIADDASAIVSVSWTHDGTIECDTCLFSMAYPVQDAVYNLTIIDENGCSETQSVQIVMREQDEAQSSVYIPNTFDPSTFGEDSVFRLQGDISNITTFVISDRWGKELFSYHGTELAAAAWNGRVNGRPIQPGVYVYLLQATLADGTEEKRVGTITVVK